MLMLSLCATIDQLAVGNSVRWYGHVLRKEDGDVLRMVLDIATVSHKKKGRLTRTRKKQVVEESIRCLF